ncbi:hypothetical protein TGRUB_237080 [Toxoplasma gondii RUB]|uniref:Uncharacterized protein n=10 Tax=Toxoplasma gondii TaxID=5811 RepID=B9PVW1_TOXGV|nr:hypothetical protein TGGT1_237080 [Toxoplasma gondii GT1]ESS31049.1 hypothetical protein TGVEG_237080 [Toxoplasma gondii VEG]KAF4640161.1 hypothetical protein TGRH88_040860 [Toxoplasma gondii]KFG36651.1 hypothetical protein TGP89_237080 [Toxoplasma gondii p89]KFG44144.1 hypothetical protein TGFOU_237080 [Toxoplasma gondii FOU]KFG62371.1 hypothetical protein TGRUB_237080 [Toxoplasma gondii RUB]KFH07578.1 hypothetical protein TGVAND_237080 [Toxoplasma gondii VAND]KFH16267.1 hypothetical pro
MKAAVALSLFGLTLALPMVALAEEMSSEMVDSVDMLEMEDVSVQETQELSEESSTAPMRYLEEDSTDDIFLIPETTSPIRVLGKKNRAVYVAAPKKYVAPVVQKKAPVAHSKYSAPAPSKKMHAPAKKAPVIMSSKYAPAPASKKYTQAAPSKKYRRLAPVPEMSEEESTATSISDIEVDDEERELKKNSGYYVAYTPVVASPYCSVGSSCARYLGEEQDMNEEFMSEEEEAVYEQSAEERSLGKKSRAVYVAPAPKKFVAPAPQKKVAAPVYRAASMHKKAEPVVQMKATPVQKKAAPVAHKKAPAFPSKKYHQAMSSSKYTPITTLSKKRRLAAQEDVAVEEESTATETETEEEERDLKKRGTYYYPVAAYPVVATPYCSTGGACY